MVRFIIHNVPGLVLLMSVFTFQYGQIYYVYSQQLFALPASIYIPIWLDLLCRNTKNVRWGILNLHSNMVRFIICLKQSICKYLSSFTFQYGQIYYLTYHKNMYSQQKHLHSNMVRFIIYHFNPLVTLNILFTFQYGQIYYSERYRIL